MGRWIRWQGILVFIAIVGLVSAGWIFFIDSIVKNLIESQGSKVVGAKVELQAVELKLYPTAVKLIGLQVTDPDAPMTNMFEVELIEFGVETLALIEEKVIINDMVVSGVGVATPRETSGALAIVESKDKEETEDSTFLGFELPKIEIPSADDILKSYEFESVTKAKALKEKVKLKREEWKNISDKLPNKEKKEEYKRRFDKIKNAEGTLEQIAALKDLKELKEDIEKDLKQIKSSQKQLKADIASLKEDTKDLKNTGTDEVDTLMNKLGLKSGSLEGVGRALIGEVASAYLDQGLDIYQKVKPMLDKIENKKAEDEAAEQDRAGGQFVKFEEFTPLPEFLIKNTKLNGSITKVGVTFDGVITDITNQPEVLRRPTKMNINAKSKHFDGLTLGVTLDHINPDAPQDNIVLITKGLSLADMSLSEDESFPILMKTAKTNIDATAKIEGESIQMLASSAFQDVNMQVPLTGDLSTIKKTIKGAFEGIRDFDVSIQVDGTLASPSIDIDTNIDDPLKDALGQSIQNKKADLKKKLEKKFQEKLQEQLGGVGGELDGFKSLEGLLSGKVGDFSSLQDLLKEQLAKKAAKSGSSGKSDKINEKLNKLKALEGLFGR